MVDFSVIGPDEHGRVYHQNAFGYGGRKQDERARWSYNPVQPPEFTAAPPPRSSFHPRIQPSLLLLRRFLLDGAGAASGSGAGSSASSLSSIAL